MSFLGGPQAVQSAPFKKVNVARTADLANTYDTIGYNLSDSDFLSKFPGLVAQRDAAIKDAVGQVEGPLDPTLQNSFATSGLSGALSSFGGNTGSIGTKGSAARGAIGTSIANQTQSKQDADRLNLMSLLQTSPYQQRQFGLSGSDQLNLLIGNIVGKNQANFAGYGTNVASANAANAAKAQEAAAAAALVVSIIGAAASASDIQLKQNVIKVGESPSGLGIYEWEYRDQPKQRWRGTVAQAIMKQRPDAIMRVGNFLFVQYSLIDIKLEKLGEAVV